MPNAPFTKSGATIVQDFAAAAQSASTKLLDFTVGSIFRALAEANAAVSDWLQKLYLFALMVSRLQTSQGQWADTFCGDYMPPVTGTTSPRLPASYATGLVTFARSAAQAQAIIPIGAQVTTFDGQQVYEVEVDLSNLAYSATIIPGGGYIVGNNVTTITVPVKAFSAGSVANVSAGAITLIRSSLIGIDSVVNNSAITTGLDAESDDALKARFKLFILSLRAGTVDAIKYAVTSLQQGLQVTVHENVDTLGNAANGVVTVYVDDGSGSISSSLVQSAAAAVNDIRAASTRPMVVGASKITANVVMVIATTDGYFHPTIVAAVSNAVGAYIQSLGLEQTLRYSMLEHIAYNASPAVINVSEVTLNGGTSDLVPQNGQTIKLGTNGVVVS